jgi:hypothetical protein
MFAVKYLNGSLELKGSAFFPGGEVFRKILSRYDANFTVEWNSISSRALSHSSR